MRGLVMILKNDRRIDWKADFNQIGNFLFSANFVTFIKFVASLISYLLICILLPK